MHTNINDKGLNCNTVKLRMKYALKLSGTVRKCKEKVLSENQTVTIKKVIVPHILACSPQTDPQIT